VFLVPLTREWLGGVIYDLTGSYQAAFAVSIGAIVVAAGSLTAAGRMGARTEIV
jgi:cyanate permease